MTGKKRDRKTIRELLGMSLLYTLEEADNKGIILFLPKDASREHKVPIDSSTSLQTMEAELM